MISTSTTTAAPTEPSRVPADEKQGSAPPLTVFTDLFPPNDADVAGHRSWLARSPWPEVVFASAR